MANFKRKRPRTKSGTTNCNVFQANHPRWWDIVFHTRPKRRHDQRLLHGIQTGADPDNMAFSVNSHRPQQYFW